VCKLFDLSGARYAECPQGGSKSRLASRAERECCVMPSKLDCALCSWCLRDGFFFIYSKFPLSNSFLFTCHFKTRM